MPPKLQKKHYEALIALLKKIEKYPTAFSERTAASFLQYGYNIRRVNYKKMAILYAIQGRIVYVHRVVAASMLID